MGSREEARVEWLKCSKSCLYFIDNYVQIYEATQATWIPFKLWPQQVTTLETIMNNRLTIILKARQLGMTWLTLAVALWKMTFRPIVTSLVFSRRDDEAIYLLERVRGMYKRLPPWAQSKKIVTSNSHIWEMYNSSIMYGFPTTAGDSYTASMAIVDEADLVPDLEALMNAVKPTIDGGGQMILLSRSNKDDPDSAFKRMYRAARDKKSTWAHVFLPWFARPERDEAWYAAQKADVLSRTGALDDLFQQYPAIDEEALQARVLDKRLPPHWLEQCFEEREPTEFNDLGLPALRMYAEPHWTRKYVIGADPAEGNPTSDDSSLHVLDAESGEEVAFMADKIEPTTFGEHIAAISRYYNDAPALIEKNNHGHAVIGHLQESHMDVRLLAGWNGDVGWLTNIKGKALLWTSVADSFRDKMVKLHSRGTYVQLGSIEGATLKAPKGLHDDKAISYALAARAASGEDDTPFAYSYLDEKQYGAYQTILGR